MVFQSRLPKEEIFPTIVVFPSRLPKEGILPIIVVFHIVELLAARDNDIYIYIYICFFFNIYYQFHITEHPGMFAPYQARYILDLVGEMKESFFSHSFGWTG